MSSAILTKDDNAAIVHALQDFVIRVASDTDDKWPEEVAVLPAITELLLTNSHLLDMKYV